MTFISIITQIPMNDMFGDNGCIIFGLSNGIHAELLIIGGFGMAIFRIICVENWVQHIEKEKLVKIIHFLEIVFVIGTTILAAYGIINAGWEKNPTNRFCNDYGLVKSEIIHSYLNYENQAFGKYKT